MIPKDNVQYVLTEDVRGDGKQGEIVVLARGYDYGLARDDTNYFGVYHVSVSRDLENGDYPFFTVPVHALKEVTPEEIPVIQASSWH